jgi:hypothetical protein
MSNNKNDHVVIALFDSEDFANYGIDLLKKWDYATPDIKLGVIGTITKKGDKVKTHVAHKTGKGAKVGAVLGIIAAVLTGGASWIVAAAGGGALGGIAGSFFKKSLHLTKEEIEALGKELDRGKVAVVVTCDEHEVEATGKQLAQYGGVLHTYAVPEEALSEVADALAAAPEEVDTEEAPTEPAIAAPVAVEAVTVEAGKTELETAELETAVDTEEKAA